MNRSHTAFVVTAAVAMGAAALTVAGAAQARPPAARLGDHPAVVVQRLQALKGYDYAAQVYPHPAMVPAAAESPPDAGAVPGRVREAPPPTPADDAFIAQRYAEAYGRFAERADAGDAAAAWMALMMVANGPTLFGTEWSATPGQLRRWAELALRHAQARSTLIPVHDRGE